MSGTRCSVVLVMWVVAISPATADPQVVAGIEIDHSAAFERLKPAAEQARQQGTATQWGAPASMVAVYQATHSLGTRLSGASGGLEVVRLKFTNERRLNLDYVARRRIMELSDPRLKIVNEDVSVVQVPGREGRRLLFETEGAWSIFAGGLLIYDRERNDLWYVQTVLLRRFLAKLFVERDRNYPKAILDTVRVIENP
jgi:hypothetical protein